MKMRHRILGLLLTLALILPLSGCKKAAVTQDDIAQNDFPVVLIDSMTSVMASDLYDRLSGSDLLEEGGVLDSSTYFDTLQAIILDSIVSIEARDVNLREDTPLYRTYLLRYRDSYVKYLYKHLILDSIRVDSATVIGLFEDHREDFSYKEQVRARHLVISADGLKYGKDSLLYKDYSIEQLDSIAEEMAYDLKAKIDSGANFGQLSTEYSVHSESGRRGGELGYFFRNTYNKEFEEVAFSLASGAISEPFKSPDGWHIIEVTDHVDSGQAPLTPEIYEEVARLYAAEKAQIRSAHLMDSIISVAEIIYNDSALSGDIHRVPDTTWAAIINGIDTITFYRMPDHVHQYKSNRGLDTAVTLSLLKDALALRARRFILMQAGDDLGFGKAPEVVKNRKALYHKYAKDVVRKRGRDIHYTPPESLIADYYEKNSNKFIFEKPVYIQHIIVEDSILGEFLRDQALSGVDFLDLAKQYYPGAEEIRVAAADLGYIGRGELPDNLYKTALATPVKSVSHPIKTEWGYHIVKVLDRKHDKTLEQVRARIVDVLKKEHQEETYREWVRELMNRHLVEYDLGIIKRIALAPREHR